MKVRVDPELCTLCMTCIDDVPEIFEVADDVAVAKAAEVPAEFEDAVKEVAEDCASEAIIIE